MKIKFFKNDKGRPENLLANAEIHLDGSFEGLKITGISLWKGKEDGTYVTLPSRKYSKDGKDAYYEFIQQSQGKDQGPVKQLKKAILEAWVGEDEEAPF